MITNNPVLAIPKKVLFNYKSYITDTEFLALLHLLAAEAPGRKGFAEAAKSMGYADTGAFSRLINSMAEKGAIIVTSYTVDVGPLWTNCIGESSQVEIKAAKKDNTHYKIAAGLLDKTNYKNVHGLAGLVKRLLQEFESEQIILAYEVLPDVRNCIIQTTKEEDLVRAIITLLNKITPTEVVSYAEYCYTTSTARNTTWIPNHYQLINWLDRWLELGKPTGPTSSKVASVEALLGQ